LGGRVATSATREEKQMLKRHVTVVVVLALGFVLGYGTLAYTQDKKQGGAPLLRPIHAAARALEQAENHLQKAEHHFGGHRAKALELVKPGTATAPAPPPPAAGTPAPATPAPATPAPKQ